MTGLLEAHTLLWAIYAPDRLSRRAAAVIDDRRNVLVVSAASAWGGHQDPFDRMIAAQALADDISAISLDAKLDQSGVRRIW